jgi:hypothetical protein
MVVREKTIELPLPNEAAISLCGNVLAALDVKSLTRDGAEVRGLFPATGRSWGERVVLRVEPLDATRSKVQISTRSRYSTQLVDWGKSNQDIATVAGMLTPDGGVDFDGTTWMPVQDDAWGPQVAEAKARFSPSWWFIPLVAGGAVVFTLAALNLFYLLSHAHT